MPSPVDIPDKAERSTWLKGQAEELGFTAVGICPSVAPPGLDHFHRWLKAGYAGQMHYLPERRDAYAHPSHVLNGVRSVVMLALNYSTERPREGGSGQGRIAQYAWGEEDYHNVIHARLKKLITRLRDQAPGALARGVVDTAPLMERDYAQLAGLGWIGKNTLLLSKTAGSYFFLAALLTDLELECNEPFAADHCGTCRACLDACPTDAFVQPYVLDASRCISYLTIEHRGPIPLELRSGMGDWIFGCDVCQQVCPWNHRAPQTSEPGFTPRSDQNPAEMLALFELDDEGFRRRFRHTPLWRSKRRGILRNAAIALGNQQSAESVAVLCRAREDDEPLVRGAVAWALGQFETATTRAQLQARKRVETDQTVCEEIDAALQLR